MQFVYSGENGVKSEAAAATSKDDVIPVSDGSDTDHKKAPAAAETTSSSQKSVKKEVVVTANDKSMNEVLVPSITTIPTINCFDIRTLWCVLVQRVKYAKRTVVCAVGRGEVCSYFTNIERLHFVKIFFFYN